MKSFEQPWRSADVKLALLACVSLAIGLATYLFVRDLRSLHFSALVTFPGQTPGIAYLVPGALSTAFGSVPAVSHAFAFSLFTALALGLNNSRPSVPCISWAIIGVVFEFAQYPDHCPEFLSYGDDVLRGFLCSYLSGGVFDWFDVGANLAGAALAYHFLRRFSNESGR